MYWWKQENLSKKYNPAVGGCHFAGKDETAHRPQLRF